MYSELPETAVNSIDNEIALVSTSIIKLDEYFADHEAAIYYLQPNGWLNHAGMQRLRSRWTPYSLCLTLLKISAATLPKTPAIAQLIEDKLRESASGIKVSVRPTHLGPFFAVEGRHFFWFGA